MASPMPLVDPVYGGRGTKAGHLKGEEDTQTGGPLGLPNQEIVARISRLMAFMIASSRLGLFSMKRRRFKPDSRTSALRKNPSEPVAFRWLR